MVVADHVLLVCLLLWVWVWLGFWAAEQVCELLKHQKVCLIRQVKQHKARSRAEPRLLVSWNRSSVV